MAYIFSPQEVGSVVYERVEQQANSQGGEQVCHQRLI